MEDRVNEVASEGESRLRVAPTSAAAGTVEEGMKAVQPLKDFGPPAVDVVGPMPYTALQQMFDPTAPWGIHSYWKTEYLLDLSEDVTSVLLDRAARLGSSFSAIHVHHLERAVNRGSENATAFGRRDVRYIVNAVGLWMDPGMHEPEVQWVRESWQALQPFSAGGYTSTSWTATRRRASRRLMAPIIDASRS